MYQLHFNGIREKWDPGPGTSTGGTPGPGTPKCLGGTRDPQSGTWDPEPQNIQMDTGPGTPKYLSGIFYSFNRLFYT